MEAGRDLIIDGAAGVGLRGVDLTAGGDMALTAGAGSIVVDAETIRKTATDGRRDIRRLDGSQLNAGGSLTLAAAEGLHLTAAELSSGGDMTLSALLGDILLDAGVERDYTSWGGKKASYTYDAKTHRVTTLEAGGDVLADAGGSLALRGTRVSGEAVTLTARTGGVALQSVTDSVFEQATVTKSGGLFTKMSDRGRYDETVRMVEIAARGPLTIDSTLGIAAEVVHQGGSLRASLDVLGQRPGLEWVAQLKDRDDVDWRRIEEAHRAWDFSAQGLNPAAAMVITIAVTIATSGAAAGAGAGVGLVNAATGVTLQGTAAAMANAAVTSLASQAAVSFVGNKGNLGATFKQLASAETVRSLAVSVASAGLTRGISEELNIDTSKGAGFGDRLAFQGVKAASTVAAQTTIGGQDFGESLRGAGVSMASALAAQTAFGTVGDLADKLGLDEGDIGKVFAHAVAGCAVGQITKNCVGGALGAGLQELAGDVFTEMADDPATQVQLAGLTAAVTMMLAGGDADAIAAANGMAQDARTYNRQLHTEEMKAIRAKAAELADGDNDGTLSPSEQLQAKTWETRLTNEALRTVDAYWNKELLDDDEAAGILAEMAATTDFDVTEGGKAVAFLKRDAFYDNRALYANFIRENADLYDPALADWRSRGAEALQGLVSPSSLAVIDSIGSASWKDLKPEDLGRSDAANIRATGATMIDALADIKAAQSDLWLAHESLTGRLQGDSLSRDERRGAEAQLQRIESQLLVSAQAATMARTGFEQLQRNGTADGVMAFAQATVGELADLTWDLTTAVGSEKSRHDLMNRVDAIATVLGDPGLVATHYSQAFAEADALERMGRTQDAKRMRAEASLELISMVAGGAGIARAAITNLPKVAELTNAAANTAEATTDAAGMATDAGKIADQATASYAKGESALARAANGQVSQRQIDEILSIPKGQRPDPSTYMSQEAIDAHLAQFKNGAVRLAILEDVEKYGTAGPPNGGFVMPEQALRNILRQAEGDLTSVEKKLGLDIGSLKNGTVVAIEIKPEHMKNLRLPSGNEGGANSQWIPGGYTSGGVPEAVMDFADTPFTPIYFYESKR